MARSDGVATSIEPTLVQRLSGALNLIVTGKTPDWFGPSNPIEPLAPRAAVEGRSFDYPVAYNINIQPKSLDAAAVDFKQLRAVADSCDVVRLCIETRKDQISRFGWVIVNKETGKADSSALALASQFSKPDGINGFHAWLRMLLEDNLVIDASTLYVNRDGKRPVFEVVDGATIKPLIDERGRRPLPPMGAYQQILKGVPAITYRADEIVYSPRNIRSHKIYGYSPVEQIITSVNLALRRMTEQMEFYRSGSVPMALIAVPETWNPDQIKAMQEIWDSIMSGNLSARSGARFIPGGTDITMPKVDAILKSEFDEWLARIVCFCFSLPPSPFVRDMNRATAQTADVQSKQEGLAPILNWAADLVNLLIVDHLKAPGYEFRWDLDAMEDPVKKDDRAVKLFQAGIVSLEVAQDIAGVERHEVAAKPAVDPTNDDDKDAGKVAKADPLPADLSEAEKAIVEALRPKFAKASERAAKAATAAVDDGAPLPADLLTETELKGVMRAVLKPIKGAARDGVAEGATELAGKAQGLPNPLDVEAPALMYAKERAAWLVGMRVTKDNTVIVNPDATYRITDVMRDALRGQVAAAIEDGLTSVQLAERIRTHEAFSVARASNIARTEIATAQEAGNMVYYKASGVVDRKQWSTANGDTCPRCVENESAGAIALDAEFPSGHQYAPAHGHCRCRTVPVIQEGIL